jgi:hypothetical protein
MNTVIIIAVIFSIAIGYGALVFGITKLANGNNP